MRALPLIVHWHNNEPLFSVDCQAQAQGGRFATAGADCEVKLWRLDTSGPEPQVKYLCNLSRHTRTVNVVRFSPNGQFIASGSDDGMVLVWQLNSGWVAPPDAFESESWQVVSSLQASKDVYDLAWSPDSRFIAGCSTDSTVFTGSVRSRRTASVVVRHSKYVQGVAWDPLNKFVVSMGSDRELRVHRIVKANSAKARRQDCRPAEGRNGLAANCLKKRFSYIFLQKTGGQLSAQHFVATSRRDPSLLVTEAQKPRKRMRKDGSEGDRETSDPEDELDEGTDDDDKDERAFQHKLFHDEGARTFFRRPCWSPEGAFLFAPSGLFQAGPSAPALHTAYIFPRSNLASSNPQPCAHVPGQQKPSVATKCCPKLFRAVAGKPQCLQLGYRIVFAVATTDSVYFYDTQHAHALAYASGLHFAEISDIAWVQDGSAVLVSSKDGFCSVIVFEPGELGEVLPDEEAPAAMKEAIELRAALAAAPEDQADAESTEADADTEKKKSECPSAKKPRRVQAVHISSADSY
eukprot:m51a1_g5913 putative chromatin assembly factor 1 subunit b (520) ;mRNA; r:32545-34632